MKDRLTELHRAAIRLLVIGVKQRDAAEIHGMSPYELSRAYRSEEGQAYAAHVRGICEQYTAAMHVLGLVPEDITRPGCRYRTPNPPRTATSLRKQATKAIRGRLGLPATPPATDRADTGQAAEEQAGTDTDGNGNEGEGGQGGDGGGTG